MLNTEKAIPLCGSANFRLPTIRKATEDWQLQSGFTLAYVIFTWNFQIIPSVGMWLRIWLPVQFQNRKPFLATAGVNSKFSAALISSLQIFTDFISLKEKQMECIWRITRLEEDVLVVFPTGFDERHDSESNKIVSPHLVVVVSPLEYTHSAEERFVWMTKKTLYFHFSCERIKLPTFALSMQWKFPETTLESRIDSFLSSLSGVAWKSVDMGRAKKKRLSVNRERSWLRHVDDQSIMPINLFNLFDSFWFDPWSLILGLVILDPWSGDLVIRWSSFSRKPFSSALAFFSMIKFQIKVHQFISL